jgi:type VI secretion system protein VasG
MAANTKGLVDRLNRISRRALEQAAQLCVTQTNFTVELEHFLLKLLDQQRTDFARILREYDIPSVKVAAELSQATEKFQRGNERTPTISPHVLNLMEAAWLIASLEFGGQELRSGALVLALIDNDALRGLLLESCPSLLALPRESLRARCREIIRDTAEEPPPDLQAPGAKPADSATPALDAYTIDVTADARAGRIDPVIGRDGEIRQIIDILARRRQNNPILVGDAGVGKTAIVEGFARAIVRGEVPPSLARITLRTLDLGLLQAGAGVKGEFENRLKTIIAEVKASPEPIILFVDEAHALIGAGGQAGQGDAANLLKPALARGELRTIAATTWAEYKRYFEKDAALVRRFQPVKVEEPDEATASDILRGLVASLEKHHGVRILDEAAEAAVRLSHRYLSGRRLPDKAIGVLDTACARVAIAHGATPPALETVVRRVERLDEQIGLLEREAGEGLDHRDRLAALAAERAAMTAERDRLDARWQRERGIVESIKALRERLSAGGGGPERAELAQLESELATLQGETPMVPVGVDARVVAAVISDWTGIPVGKMLRDEIRTVLELKERMAQRLIGQPQALDAIARRIRTYRAHLDEPGKPMGVFLLVGPSGVGKTETAAVLADLLFGGERNVVICNMSEFQEAHSVATLKGAPPGYVGYGKGGILTEAVRRNPYAVILLDEFEKAHGDVVELFYQVFDKGVLEDGEGVEVDFRNCLILATSNIGTELLMQAAADPSLRTDAAALVERLRPALLRRFKPALLGRLVVVPYLPLGEASLEAIVELKLAKIAARFQESYGARLTFDPGVAPAIAARSTDIDSGARAIDQILTHALLPGLSAELLERAAEERRFAVVDVTVDPAGAFRFRFEEAAQPAAAYATAGT